MTPTYARESTGDGAVWHEVVQEDRTLLQRPLYIAACGHAFRTIHPFTHSPPPGQVCLGCEGAKKRGEKA